MAPKLIAVPPKKDPQVEEPKKTFIQTDTINISAEQFLAIINRITNALERSEGVAAIQNAEQGSLVPDGGLYKPGTGPIHIGHSQPKEVVQSNSLESMIANAFETAYVLRSNSEGLRGQLYGETPGENSVAGTPVVSLGLNKDRILIIHENMVKTMENLRAISQYVVETK